MAISDVTKQELSSWTWLQHTTLCGTKGMLVKLSKVLPCWAVSVIELLLEQRRFRVHMGDISSSWRVQKNGLPQGSVLAPTLFNLYINDLSATRCRKFIYADDICLAHQERTFEDLNITINADIAKISEYCKRWRLQPNVAKNVSSTFLLHNARINQELDILLNGKRLRHDNRHWCHIDCTLTYKPHLRKAAAKTRTCNNLVHMLAGTTWGSSLAARGGNLAKIPPNQVIDDFGRGSSVESETEWCQLVSLSVLSYSRWRPRWRLCIKTCVFSQVYVRLYIVIHVFGCFRSQLIHLVMFQSNQSPFSASKVRH